MKNIVPHHLIFLNDNNPVNATLPGYKKNPCSLSISARVNLL
jgi:hypothetical protein